MQARKLVSRKGNDKEAQIVKLYDRVDRFKVIYTSPPHAHAHAHFIKPVSDDSTVRVDRSKVSGNV